MAKLPISLQNAYLFSSSAASTDDTQSFVPSAVAVRSAVFMTGHGTLFIPPLMGLRLPPLAAGAQHLPSRYLRPCRRKNGALSKWQLITVNSTKTGREATQLAASSYT